MFSKMKNYFNNIFREYKFIFANIDSKKIDIKTGISKFIYQYDAFISQEISNDVENNYLKPIKNLKLVESIELNNYLLITTFKLNLLNKMKLFSIHLYEQGINTYISFHSKKNIIFHPEQFNSEELEKEKINLQNGLKKQLMINNKKEIKNPVLCAEKDDEHCHETKNKTIIHKVVPVIESKVEVKHENIKPKQLEASTKIEYKKLVEKLAKHDKTFDLNTFEIKPIDDKK